MSRYCCVLLLCWLCVGGSRRYKWCLKRDQNQQPAASHYLLLTTFLFTFIFSFVCTTNGLNRTDRDRYPEIEDHPLKWKQCKRKNIILVLKEEMNVFCSTRSIDYIQFNHWKKGENIDHIEWVVIMLDNGRTSHQEQGT